MLKNTRVSAKDIRITNRTEANDAKPPTQKQGNEVQPTVVTQLPLDNTPVTLDEPDAGTTKKGAESTGATRSNPVSHSPASQTEPHTDTVSQAKSLALNSERFPFSLLKHFTLVVSRTGRVYAVITDRGNLYCLPVGSKALNQRLREIALDQGALLRKHELAELNEILSAHGEMNGQHQDVWYRVAKIDNGTEIDLGDQMHTRVRIRPDKVDIIANGSSTLFSRASSTRPFVKPAEKGDHSLIRKYLNLDDMTVTLFIGWLTYTLAHPKSANTGYVHLVVKGDQGSGKSFLTKLIHELVDPSSTGVRLLPRAGKDLAIAIANTHVASFDNIRGFAPDIADLLCVTATGGSLPSRQLYTDDTEHALPLHGAVVLNGIPAFVTQPDLAQRCLTVSLKPLKPEARRSESDLMAEFEADLPVILRGLFEYIAKILKHYPTAEVTNPERMLDYARWIAAMEKVDGVPAGVYQGAYSHQLHEAELDTLLDNPLAFAIVEFARDMDDQDWSGTPTELYDRLCLRIPDATQRSKYWPSNPIAMSKRLIPVIAGLRDQGIDVQMVRGKQRRISITLLEGFDHE